MALDFDVCIVGGGVIGLAIARQLSVTYSVLLLERHTAFGTETSSRNSEVIHAGLYYQPDSLKERLCVEGRQQLYRFCEDHDVPHRAIGKLIVSQSIDHPELARLHTTARRLDIALETLSRQQIQKLEPEVRAEAGLYSPATGIIDSHLYMYRLQQQAESHGAILIARSGFIGATATDTGWQIRVESPDGDTRIECAVLINSAGLAAHQVARLAGFDASRIPVVYPCKGHYFGLSGKAPFRHLVYPMPEINMVGLGIHATIDQNNQVRFGPDTLYSESPEQMPDYQVPTTLTDRFASAIQSYYPALNPERLYPDYAGIRPKLSGPGQPVRDFLIEVEAGDKPLSIHLFGIESPGLTASLALARQVGTLLEENM